MKPILHIIITFSVGNNFGHVLLQLIVSMNIFNKDKNFRFLRIKLFSAHFLIPPKSKNLDQFWSTSVKPSCFLHQICFHTLIIILLKKEHATNIGKVILIILEEILISNPTSMAAVHHIHKIEQYLMKPKVLQRSNQNLIPNVFRRHTGNQNQ